MIVWPLLGIVVGVLLLVAGMLLETRGQDQTRWKPPGRTPTSE